VGYDLKDTLPFSSRLYDSTGALVNATSVTLTITLPDQTTVTPAITNPPVVTGTYSYDYVTTTQPGRYVGVWLFTMATGKTTTYPEVFDVAPSDPGFVVSLKQAKDQTNITASTSDDELALYVASATRVVEYFVGPVVIRPYTQILSADRPLLSHLPKLGPGLTPVLTLTSLTPLYTTGSSSWTTSNTVVNPVTGEIRQTSGVALWGGPWTAVYTAGQRVVDSNWQLAALIVVQHLWETQRGASGLPLAPSEETFIPGLGFAIPNRAADLLQLDSTTGVA
jgi:hypothetical protein